MPPQACRKVVFDTNIYIHAIRGGPAARKYALLINTLPFTYLSSVVSAELYLGAPGFLGSPAGPTLCLAVRKSRAHRYTDPCFLE
jgi:predicted nucleic acid-binding protein